MVWPKSDYHQVHNLSSSLVIMQIHMDAVFKLFVLLVRFHLLRGVHELSGELQTVFDIVATERRGVEYTFLVVARRVRKLTRLLSSRVYLV